VGETTITATKAEDATYSGDTASYVLTISQKQLTIGNPTINPKQYDGDETASVTPSTLIGVVSGDTVSVSAIGTYASPNAGDNIDVTVVYSISGADADNYIAPFEVTIHNCSITKANGADVNTNPTAAAKTETTITSSVVTTSGGQTVEYAINTNNHVPSDGWQDSQLFTGLTPSTGYFIFARSKGNNNYDTGEAKVSSEITTNAPILDIIRVDFTNVELSPILNGAQSPTLNSSNSAGYTYTQTNNSQGYTFKVNLGSAKLSDYETIYFTVATTTSGNSQSKHCNVAGNLSKITTYSNPGAANAAFVTTAGTSNNIGSTFPMALAFTIDGTKADTLNLTGEFWLAIFIDAQGSANYTISDFVLVRKAAKVDFTNVELSPILNGAQSPTLNSSNSAGYTYTQTNNSQGYTFKVNLGADKLSDYKNIYFTVATTTSGNSQNKHCNVAGNLSKITTYSNPGAANAAFVTTAGTSNNIGSTFPMALAFTIDETKADTLNLTGEFWLAIFIDAQGSANYTISDFVIVK